MGGDTSTRRRRRGFSLIGLLLIALGALLLLTVTGVAGLGVWFELVGYWPVLLILIGIKLILAPRAPLVGMALVSLMMVATIVAAWVPLNVERRDEAPRIAYSTPLENTETFELGMGFTGGRVTLRSDPSADRLFAADFNQHPVDVIHDHRGSFAKIYLSTEPFSVWHSPDDVDSMDGYSISADGTKNALPPYRTVPGTFYFAGMEVCCSGRPPPRDGYVGDGSFNVGGLADWDLMVSPDVALDLEIKAGAADLDLDLTHLNVRRLIVGAAASQIRIRLPAAGIADMITHVEIEAGAADIEITVPQGVAARIDSDSFLNFTSIDSSRFPESGGEHRSPDYSTAENRVDIEIGAGAASVTVS